MGSITARVQARPGEADKPTRQDAYLRALGTLPGLDIIFGQFLTHAVRLPRADGGGYETVLRTEEKGSDVNLATHLLHDAHRGLSVRSSRSPSASLTSGPSSRSACARIWCEVR